MLGDMGYNCDMRLAGSDLAPIFWLAVATVLLLVPLPEGLVGWSQIALLDDLQDLLHFPLFVALASLAFRTLRSRLQPMRRAPYVIAMAASTTFALATEGMQGLVGREFAWRDLIMDLSGAGFGLLLHARAEVLRAGSGRGVRTGLLLAAATIALLASGRFLWTAAAYGYRAAQAPVMWRPESRLLNRFSHWQGDPYPGLVIDEPPSDWRERSQLEIRIRNRGNRPLPVVVRVHDRSHDLSHHDRYNRNFELQPGSDQTLHIPIEEIRSAPANRTMDLGAIRGVGIYSPEPAGQTRGFDVLEVRLGR